MNFEPRKRYRHISTLDVDIYIVKVLNVSKRSTKLDVLYINRNLGDGNSFISLEPDTVRIFHKYKHLWSTVD